MKSREIQPENPDQFITLGMTRQEALCLLQGAIKGNVIYGSVANKQGQMTLKLVGRFCKEFGFKLDQEIE